MSLQRARLSSCLWLNTISLDINTAFLCPFVHWRTLELSPCLGRRPCAAQNTGHRCCPGMEFVSFGYRPRRGFAGPPGRLVFTFGNSMLSCLWALPGNLLRECVSAPRLGRTCSPDWGGLAHPTGRLLTTELSLHTAPPAPGLYKMVIPGPLQSLPCDWCGVRPLGYGALSRLPGDVAYPDLLLLTLAADFLDARA